MTNGRVVHCRSSMVLVGFLPIDRRKLPGVVHGSRGRVRLMVHDVKGDAAAWSPREVIIHKGTDLEGGTELRSGQPTPRTHVFEAPGLFEQTIAEGSENATVKPRRVYVAPGGTVHIRFSAERLNREPGTDASEAQTSHLCPLHKGEKAFRSQIQIVA